MLALVVCDHSMQQRPKNHKTNSISCFNTTKKLPKNEEYLLKSQLVRALRSVTNNIAEGYGRFHYKENAQFCRVARGSLYEVLDHLIIGYEDKYLTKEDLLKNRELVVKAITILNGYIKYLINASENKTINK